MYFRAQIKRAAAAFILCALAATIANAQTRTAIPGTSVSVAAPAGFSVSTQFAGLVDQSKTASFLVVEFPPIAYEQISTLFKDLESVKANFARQQVMIETLDMLDTGAGKVPFATGTQAVAGTTFDKWIALYKGEKTVLITIQAPQSSKLGADMVRAMLASVTLGEAPKISEKLNALPFLVKVIEPYRAIDTIGGIGVLMTVGPLDADPSEGQPNVIVVYQATSPVDLSNLEASSEVMLQRTRGYANAQVTSKAAVTFAGVKGFVTRGTRKTDAGADKQFVHYLGVAPDNRHVRLIASGDEKQMSELKPALEQIVASIGLKDPK